MRKFAEQPPRVQLNLHLEAEVVREVILRDRTVVIECGRLLGVFDAGFF